MSTHKALQILLCILTIGLVGFALDRLMGVAERRLRAAV